MPTKSYTGTLPVTRYYSNIGTSTGDRTFGPYVTRTYTMGGQVTTPGYRPKGWAMRRIRLHACTTTSLTAEEWYYTGSPTDMSYQRNWSSGGKTYAATYRHWGDGLPYFTTLAQDNPEALSYVDPTRADNQAKGRLLQDVREKIGELQSLTVAGELMKTIATIVRPGRALREGLLRWNKTAAERCRNAIRQKNGWRVPKSKRRAAVEKTISDSWLEWTFGIKPIVYDLDNAARALAENITQNTVWASPVYGSGFGSTRTYSRTINQTSGNSNTLYWDIFRYRDATVTYRGKVVLRPSRVLRMQRVGLTFDRFAPQIWELIPYSWLVDYFANISDVVEGLSFSRSDLAWVQKTTILDSHSQAENLRHVVGTPSTAFNLKFSPGSAVYGKRSITRNQYFGSLVPSIQFRIPGISTQWANMAAVVISAKQSQRFIAQLLR